MQVLFWVCHALWLHNTRLLSYRQVLLQARDIAKVRVVLESRARDQILLRHHVVSLGPACAHARNMLIAASDPFVEMAKANKTYGFTIAVKELKETVPNIFRYASAYKRVNNITSQGMWEMFTIRPEDDENFSLENDPRKRKPPLEEIDDRGQFPEIDTESMEGEVYNMCHFWSNFEIARLDWFRSKEYEEFFQMMDHSGGFWMERVSTIVLPLCR